MRDYWLQMNVLRDGQPPISFAQFWRAARYHYDIRDGGGGTKTSSLLNFHPVLKPDCLPRSGLPNLLI